MRLDQGATNGLPFTTGLQGALAMKFLSWGMAAAFVGVVVSGATPASATAMLPPPVVYDITSDHCTGGCAAPGTIFGTVTLQQNLTTVDITVDLNDPFVWARTGAADQQFFKFNAVDVTTADITVNQTFA